MPWRGVATGVTDVRPASAAALYASSAYAGSTKQALMSATPAVASLLAGKLSVRASTTLTSLSATLMLTRQPSDSNAIAPVLVISRQTYSIGALISVLAMSTSSRTSPARA